MKQFAISKSIHRTLPHATKLAVLCAAVFGGSLVSPAVAQENSNATDLPVYTVILKDQTWTDYPTVSVTTPERRARSNGNGFRLKLDPQAIQSRLAAIATETSNHGDYYKEARGFSNIELGLRLRTWKDGNGPGATSSEVDLSSTRLSLDQSEHTVVFDQAVSSFVLTIHAERTEYKCFSPETCVLNGKVTREIPFNFGLATAGNSLLQTHEAILESEQQDMVISRRLDFDKAGQFQIKLKNGPAVAQLGLESLLLGFPVSDWVSINAQGQDALSAQDFIGASGALAYHGTPSVPESQSPRWNAHVYPAGDGIKVRVERLPYYTCHYGANYGDNTQMSLTMPPGSTCPNVPSHSFVAATPGQDDTAIKEWWFGNRNN